MKKYFIALSMVSLFSSAGEYETVLGLGHQYGGLGAQFAYKVESSRYFASLGIAGFAAGFQTTFSQNSKHVAGVAIGREDVQSEDGFLFATYDYHFNGFSNPGLVLGTGIGKTRQDQGGLFANLGETESSTSLTLSIGYKF